MKSYFKNCIFTLILLNVYLISTYDLNNYFKAGKNQKIISDRNRFFKFDLIQFPINEKLSTKNPVTILSFRKRKLVRKQKKSQFNEYVWDDIGKYWTYKNRIESYPNYFPNEFPNSPCKPPFCYPRRCNHDPCSQSNCFSNSRLCPINNSKCGVGQKSVIFGSEVVCVNEMSDDNCIPSCGENGICIKGKCYCETGWYGEKCSILEAELCKRKKQIFCVHGCIFDKRINDFNCVCGLKETNRNCVQVQTCKPSCKNGGVCILGKCQCTEGFEGDDCQSEINSCSPGQMGNKTCEQLCISQDKNNFQCKCTVGYFLKIDGRSCEKDRCSNIGTLNINGNTCECKSGWQGKLCNEDIDECKLQQCQQICVNTIGSYKCSCLNGFNLLSNGKCVKNCLKNCSENGDCINGICYCFSGWHGDDCSVDIDECKYSHKCEQICVNLLGKYECQCHSGYSLQADRKNCLPKPCKNNCQNNGWCENNKCICQPGFTGANCENVNFCHFYSPCQHNCTNINDRMVCSCWSGYKLLSDGISCSKDCKCVNGICREDQCICNEGYTGSNCEIDIDECNNKTHKCDQICKNIDGSYLCSCFDGFQLMPDNRSCKKLQCPICVRGKCINGNCICPIGFIGARCENDINECDNKTLCQQFCINTFGSFHCGCQSGYQLTSNSRSCIPIKKITCAELDCVHGYCSDSKCICKSGFKGIRCDEDINECQVYKKLCQQNCINTEGSYKCFCQPGFMLSNDNHTCLLICPFCVNGKCDVTRKCQCKRGWTGDLCNVDIDECFLQTHNCQQNCINTNGSYTCSCNLPYYLSTFDGRTCLDKIDNCSVICKNGGKCKNSKCECKPGYTGNSCEEDINECMLPPSIHGCIGECRNTYGNYECICPPGYLVMNDQKTCEISTKDTMCNPHCLNGGVCRDKSRCFCPTGFQGIDCGNDVDECQRYAPCDKSNGVCQNTYGSFYCQCTSNYVLMYDGTSCMTITEAILRPHLRYRGKGTKGVTRVIEN